MSTLFNYQPNYATHPGKSLREKLEEIKMLPKEFSVRSGKPVKTISNIITGKSSITPEMAVQFERVLKIPASFWLKLQANYDEFVARQTQGKNIDDALDWANKFPYPKMAKLGWVRPTRKNTEKAEELLNFFNISKASSWDNIYLKQELPLFLRISLKHAKDPYALSAWLTKGEITAKGIDSPEYNAKILKGQLPVLKKVMAIHPENFFSEIQKVCLKAGVRVILTPIIPNTAISGAVRWIDKKPIIQVSDRYKRYDMFWFSLFHEIGHILLHGNKKNIFIEDTKNIELEDIKEKQANDFAKEWLLTDYEQKN